MPLTGQPEFGILANIGQAERSTEIDEVCRAADELGFERLAFGDHLSWPIPEAWTVLAWAAGRTDEIKLTHLVLNNIYRHPSMLAQMGATLDFLSDGRFELGIGAGSSNHEEYRPYGLPYRSFSERLARLEESLSVIQQLWEGGESAFEGVHFNLEGADLSPMPVQEPRPPVLLGGQSQELMELAGRYEGWNFGFDLPPESCRKYLNCLQAQIETKGTKPEYFRTPHGVLLLIDNDDERLAEKVNTVANDQAMDPTEFRRQFTHSFVGLPEEIIPKVQAYRGVGIEDFFLWGPSVRNPKDLELFMSEVVPALD